MLLKVESGLKNISRISSILFLAYFFSQLCIMQSIEYIIFSAFLFSFPLLTLFKQSKLFVLFLSSIERQN